MSFEKIIADRTVYLPYVIPGEEEVKFVDLKPNVVTKVPTAVLAAIGARKGSPLESYFEKGILRKVRRDNAETDLPNKPTSQLLAERLAAGETVEGNFGQETEENIEGIQIPTTQERELPRTKPLPKPFRGINR